jgi:glycosyltransferase involved in cell wall biosynthesis
MAPNPRQARQQGTRVLVEWLGHSFKVSEVTAGLSCLSSSRLCSGEFTATANLPLSLSVIIITHNEAGNIADCLAGVAFADEIVVLDSGSTDHTVELARAAGAVVHISPNWPGFGPQKNRALALAGGDWVLSLDADERVTPELAAQIQKAMSDGEGLAYRLPRLTQFCGRWIYHCGWTPDHVLRLFKRGTARFSDDLVHERLVLSQGKIKRLQAPLLHFSYPTPGHYWRKLEQYSQAWALQRHALGHTTSMSRAALSGVVTFVRAYFFRLGFLDGAMGFAVCSMQAQAAFGKYFALYCLNQDHEAPNNP